MLEKLKGQRVKTVGEGQSQGGCKTVRRRKMAQKTQAVAGSRVSLDAAQRRAHGAAVKTEAPEWRQVYQHSDEKGVPCTALVKRKMGRDKPSQPEGMGYWEFVDCMMLDLMIISRSEVTWMAYARWFGVFEEWCEIMGVDWQQASLLILASVLARSLTVMWYEAEYAASTLELYTTAVAARIADEGKGKIREDFRVQRVLEGIRRKKGCYKRKKLAMEAYMVRALMERAPPDSDGVAWTGAYTLEHWLGSVGATVMGWMMFLRCSEILNLQLCDFSYEDDNVLVANVRQTKADKRGYTTETEFHRAAPGSRFCLLTFVEGALSLLHGDEWRVPHECCTKQQDKGYECPHCRWAFPHSSAKGVMGNKQQHSRLLRKRLKAPLQLLEDDGILEPGLLHDMSVISLRRGGNSVAAAEGAREAVRTKHGRWGVAGKTSETGTVRKTSEKEYNQALSHEGAQVSVALNRAVNKKRKQPITTGTRKRRKH